MLTEIELEKIRESEKQLSAPPDTEDNDVNYIY